MPNAAEISVDTPVAWDVEVMFGLPFPQGAAGDSGAGADRGERRAGAGQDDDGGRGMTLPQPLAIPTSC